MKTLPKHVVICETGLRDGLQNEKTRLTTDQKQKLLELVTASGIKRVEIGSLANPKEVPSWADTDELFRQADKLSGVEYRALIMNRNGLLRAKDVGIGKAKLVVSASRTHCLRN